MTREEGNTKMMVEARSYDIRFRNLFLKWVLDLRNVFFNGYHILCVLMKCGLVCIKIIQGFKIGAPFFKNGSIELVYLHNPTQKT